MNSCVIYFYKSNKNYYKEDYESAYICSYLDSFGNCDIILYSSLDPIILIPKYDLYFIKLYDKEQIALMELVIEHNCIDVKSVYFYGQYCRNNYLHVLKHFSSCNGVIIGDEFDTISAIIHNPLNQEGLAICKDGHVYNHLKLSKHINIENIPIPDRTIAKKIEQNYVEVMFSRGCKKHCSFCTIASSNFYDCKSNQLIIDELKDIIFTTGIHKIIFKDLSFDDRIYKYGRKSFEELAYLIIKNNLNIKYDVNFRIGTFSLNRSEDKSLFKVLRKSGLVRILFGVESFVDSDLTLYNKNYNVSDIIDSIELCRQYFIYPICSFIFLNPYSTLEQLKINLFKCHQLGLLDFLPASLNVLRPEKCSLLYEKLIKDKLIISNDENIRYLWKNQDTEIIANLFQTFYIDKKIWRIYIFISRLHELLCELEFLGVRSKAESIVTKTKKLFNKINDMNYEFLLSLINKASNVMNSEELHHDFDNYLDFISNNFYSEFEMLYREIRKEIEIVKKVLEKKVL